MQILYYCLDVIGNSKIFILTLNYSPFPITLRVLISQNFDVIVMLFVWKHKIIIKSVYLNVILLLLEM